MLKLSKQVKVAKPILALSCLGFMVSGLVALTGCAGGGGSQQEVKQEAPMIMNVEQVDQLSTLGDKTADGQYLVAKVSMRNNSNATIVLDPTNFVLENITDNEKERYSQPLEKGMTNPFVKVYGEELKSKVMDFDVTNLYPRMQLERYFVFMVPSDAAVNGYQITYKPANISIPLVTSEATVINDHRNQSTLPTINDAQSATEPNKP